MGLMNYQHASYMSSGTKMLTETCLMNYRHDRHMSGEQKTLEIETDQQHIDMIGVCQVNLKSENRGRLKKMTN